MSAQLWNQCLGYLEQKLTPKDFNTWIRPLQADEDADYLRLYAPNQFVLERIKKDYQQHINTVITHVKPKQEPKLLIQVGSPKTHQQKKRTIGRSPITSETFSTHLNPHLNFNSFVTGESNRLAQFASFQFAEQGGYNPLFIYGGVGLGKTHLMHAVGNHIMSCQPGAKVSYVRAEQFVNEMVKSLKENKMSDFKKRYRSLDALLIDDVQFFANKTRSQEELYHTFNVLLEDSQNKIVLASDRVPQQIQGMEDRLKSRFSSGLSVSVTPPDFSTRLTILETKARLAKIELPTDVNSFIAEHIQSNVRELEGALNRLIAVARLLRKKITLDSAQSTLEDLCSIKAQEINAQIIQELVADYYKVSVADLCSKRRHRQIVRPRQMAMFLIKELTDHSLPEIGSVFGGRDHTTVLHGCKTIDKLKATDVQVNKDYLHLLSHLS